MVYDSHLQVKRLCLLLHYIDCKFSGYKVVNICYTGRQNLLLPLELKASAFLYIYLFLPFSFWSADQINIWRKKKKKKSLQPVLIISTFWSKNRMKNESKNSASVIHVGKTFFFFFSCWFHRKIRSFVFTSVVIKLLIFFPSVADMQVIFFITGSE